MTYLGIRVSVRSATVVEGTVVFLRVDPGWMSLPHYPKVDIRPFVREEE